MVEWADESEFYDKCVYRPCIEPQELAAAREEIKRLKTALASQVRLVYSYSFMPSSPSFCKKDLEDGSCVVCIEWCPWNEEKKSRGRFYLHALPWRHVYNDFGSTKYVPTILLVVTRVLIRV